MRVTIYTSNGVNGGAACTIGGDAASDTGIGTAHGISSVAGLNVTRF